MHPDARGWFVAAWATFALLAALAVGFVSVGVVLCDVTFSWVDEPVGWRDWPLSSSEVLGPGCWGTGCKRSVATPAVFPPDQWLRRSADGTVFVIAARPRVDEAPSERFLGAFRRVPVWSWGFTSRWTAGALGVLGLALGVVATGLGRAHLCVRRASKAARGIRAAYGAVASTPPTYRRAPRASEPGPSDDGLLHGARSARRALRLSLLAAGGILIVSLSTGAACVVREVLRVLA